MARRDSDVGLARACAPETRFHRAAPPQPERSRDGDRTGGCRLEFADLPGWSDDDFAAAWAAFRATSAQFLENLAQDWLTDEFRAAVQAAHEDKDRARRAFESLFRPTPVEDGEPGLATGYFEPELVGSRQRSGRFLHPVHRPPAGLDGTTPWKSRREILEDGALDGQGLEIAWLEDPVDAYLLQVQGSGRIRFADGGAIRVGFGGSNNLPYASIGAALERRGDCGTKPVDTEALRAWIRENPAEGRELMLANPRYVFFREISGLASDEGPVGTMGCPLVAMRSVAVDADRVPLGSPVWLEIEGDRPMRRLMVAQDTGAAIKGAQRVDVFCGTGEEAGLLAGRMRDRARVVVLELRQPAGN